MLTDQGTTRVVDLMTADPITIAPEAQALEAERLLKTYRVSGLPVVDGRELVGVISQSDIVLARSSQMIGDHWDRMRVRNLMTAPPVTVHATATLPHAAHLMVTHQIHRLVVIGDDGAPIGVLTTLDLLRSITAGDRPPG